jgi:N6-L-threonylcarbamoyladenine synthase
VSAAKALSLAWRKPVVGVNHLEGHIASASLGTDKLSYPCLVLLVSGGHSMLVRVEAPGDLTVLGSTRDDSAGEAYDKVARLLGLGYPGGPVVDRLAAKGTDSLKFPRPLIDEGLDFSFSGLKTAVAYYLRREPRVAPEAVAASFAAAVMDVLVAKLEAALARDAFECVAVVGGVAASPVLRARLGELRDRCGIRILLPPAKLATDNGAMIAAAGWTRYRTRGGDPLDFSVDPSLSLPGMSG